MTKHMLPNRSTFAADPFGYASSAWIRWAIIQEAAGFPVDPEKAPTSDDLKSPVLWLLHARALSEAAAAVLKFEPKYEQLPRQLTGICDSQYCAVGLMLVGYSLEICLKAMLILRHGVAGYAADEKRHFHHKLDKLADFMPELSDRDRTILRLLADYLTWAGRYPDPGSRQIAAAEGIFTNSEAEQVAARDIFDLATRIMQRVADEGERAA